MIDFLNPKLTPKVTCTSPSMDNYEPSNLISDKHLEKSRGFMAYSAIKPPVTVTFEFVCPVNVHYVKLETTVGAQKSTGIEIFAKTASSPFMPISKAFYDTPSLIFCNSRKYSKKNVPELYSDDCHLSYFKSDTYRTFLNATGLQVVIFRTEKSVPCLKSVQVWGLPSKNCSPKTVETIKKIVNKSTENLSNVAKETVKTFVIPEDFKDDLTYEIMSVPLTMPSGKTIDQSTLDKHVKSELSFGRKPCDPFTGIKFTDKIKPVINVALKSRIDMFVLQNSHREELGSVKRTTVLGRGKSEVRVKRKAEESAVRSVKDEDDNIEHLVNNIKRNSNFVSFTKTRDDDDFCCLSCRNSDDFLYEILNCFHRFCKTCLLKLCKKCSECDTTFSNSDVRKCNV